MLDLAYKGYTPGANLETPDQPFVLYVPDPGDVVESLGLEETADDVKKAQDSPIGAIYKLIHEVNRKVADLATDLLEQRGGKQG